MTPRTDARYTDARCAAALAGGISGQILPLLCNRRTDGIPAGSRLRIFDIFDVALDHIQ